MNLLVISDLHIGNSDYFETFGWKGKQFIKMLNRIIEAENIHKVILNGDIFELYKYSFDEICATNRKLVNYLLFNPKMIYLKGNHDALCKFGKENLIINNSKGQKIYIEHGHSADFLNGSGMGRKIQTLLFSIIRILIKNKFLFKIYHKIHLWEEAMNTIPKKYDSIRYLSHALKLLKDFDVVILGHTHKIEEHKTFYLNQKKHYINSGSCSMGRLQGVILNTESLKFETFKFKNIKDASKHYKSKEYCNYLKTVTSPTISIDSPLKQVAETLYT